VSGRTGYRTAWRRTRQIPPAEDDADGQGREARRDRAHRLLEELKAGPAPARGQGLLGRPDPPGIESGYLVQSRL